MKKYIGLFALMILLLFVACDPDEPEDSKSPSGNSSGAPPASERVDYLSVNEQARIDEMNFARTEPQRYVREVLQPFKDNNCYTNAPYTQADIDALESAITTMTAMTAVEALKPALGLTLASRDFIADPKRNVHASTSPGFIGFSDRAQLYGGFPANENAWPTSWQTDGTGTCEETVTSGWIIDRGNGPNYGHRTSILDPDNRYVGLAFGTGAANSDKTDYQNIPATYSILAKASYMDKTAGDYKGGAAAGTATDALTKTSISEVVTWPVLRYIDGEGFVQFDAAGAKGAVVTPAPGG